MELPKNIDPKSYEDKIYQLWEDAKAFQPSETGVPFSIMMPPPNATGQLHLGHAIMLAIQDIIIRHKRMQGYSTLWLPGTDHAGIATQTRVEKNLLQKGISKDDLGREKFLQEVDQFVEGSKSTIRNQVKKMGCSCDWTKERFTLEPHLNSVVNKVFCDMYADELIYKGHRIVNWDPLSQTAIADDEVEYKEQKATLYYIKYGPLTIATSRPETKLADTGVAVHPDDERYQHLIGQTLSINFGEHQISVKVIADKAVDPEFGTGAIGLTPAHSLFDYDLAQKHNLEIIQLINQEGIITEAGGKYQGLTVLQAREKFVEELKLLDLIEKQESYKQNLSISYRSGGPIEPLISEQWFIDVNKPVVDWNGDKLSLREVSTKVIQENQIEFIPNRFQKTYFRWMENLHDWCISRQLWYGHRIPAWYNNQSNEMKVQAESPGPDWTQESDTLDTWFSSGLWTFSTLGWPENTDDFKKFHPTDLLETGYDILPFWVARMILMTTYATKQIPFKKVYLHGLIRDRHGKKMSKSLGNGIDPLDMIEKYGTDALRLSLVIGNSPGNDLKIYEEKVESYRNFITKVWNSARFILSKVDEPTYIQDYQPENLSLADKWILTRLQQVIEKGTELLNEYKISEAGNFFYEFLWDEVSNWYLEFSKNNINQNLLNFLIQNILTLLHPFIPFVTEEIWSNFKPKNLLINETWPTFNGNLVFKEAKDIELIIEIIKAIRSEKATFDVATDPSIEITIISQNTALIEQEKEYIEKLGKVKVIAIKKNNQIELKHSSLKVISEDTKFYMHLEGKIDFDKETEKTKQEIKTTESNIKNLEARLSNKKYVDNAPKELVNETKIQLEQSKSKLNELQTRLNFLN